MTETRKLAAILAADVVGFSRLAGADENHTLERLRALRSDLIDPTIAVHQGRVVKRTGHGALVEFRGVVDAVRCAVEVQNGMVERNAGADPARPRNTNTRAPGRWRPGTIKQAWNLSRELPPRTGKGYSTPPMDKG
jgi:class 3 adenylate cyclase